MSETLERAGTAFTQDGDNFIVQQDFFNQVPLLLVTFALVFAAGWLTFNYSNYWVIPLEISQTLKVPIPVALFAPLTSAAVLAHRLLNCRIVLTPEYLIFIEGRLAWHDRSVRLEYQRIQEIEIDHSLLQKALGLGDLIVTPIATDVDSCITLKGVRNVTLLKDVIRDFAKRAQGSDAGIHAAVPGHAHGSGGHAS